MMETEILSALILFSAGSLAIAGICFYKQRKNRELLEFVYSQMEEMEICLALNKEMIENATQVALDHGRRVAWLETRFRQPKLSKKDILDESSLNPVKETTKQLNLTERRHRVLSLAQSGQDTETIALMLGMLPGEVELIVNLNRANFA